MSIEALASYVLNEVALDGDYGRFFMLLYSFFDSYTIHSGASELEKLSSYISAPVYWDTFLRINAGNLKAFSERVRFSPGLFFFSLFFFFS